MQTQPPLTATHCDGFKGRFNQWNGSSRKAHHNWTSCSNLSWLSPKATADANSLNKVPTRKAKGIQALAGTVMIVLNLVFLVLLARSTAQSGKRKKMYYQSSVLPLPSSVAPSCYINIYRHSSIHPGPVDYHWWEPTVWRRRWTSSRGQHMACESTRSCWSYDRGPEAADHSRATCYEGRRWAGNGGNAFMIQSLDLSIALIIVASCFRLCSLSVFVFFPPDRSKWRERIISVENRPDSSHPACVYSGMSEYGLLHVCLEGRQDSL